MFDNRGSKIISCAHEYHKSIVNIVVKTKKYKASCFLERQCSTMFNNRRSKIISCAHEYYKYDCQALSILSLKEKIIMPLVF